MHPDRGELEPRLRVTPSGVQGRRVRGTRPRAHAALEAERSERHLVVLGAQTRGLRLGYQPVGRRYMEAGIEHQTMERPLG